jgi:DNA-binding XRE family transcriptional regulator
MVEMTGPWKKFCRIAMRAGLSKTDMADVLGCSRRSVQLWVKNNTAPSERLKPVVLAATDILQKLIDIKELPTMHSAVRMDIVTKAAYECRHGTMAPRV